MIERENGGGASSDFCTYNILYPLYTGPVTSTEPLVQSTIQYPALGAFEKGARCRH